jgi:hypothetical protein
MPTTGKPAQKVKSPNNAQEEDANLIFLQKRTKTTVLNESKAPTDAQNETSNSAEKNERSIIKARRRFKETGESDKSKPDSL